MPFGASFIIGSLLYYQRKAKKMGVLQSRKMTLHEFCSEVDLGGIILFVVGFACFLLPLTIAASLPKGWYVSNFWFSTRELLTWKIGTLHG